MTVGESCLIAWSGLAFVWWLIALSLLARGPKSKHTPPRLEPQDKSGAAPLTVFKPLPPVQSEAERAALLEAIESFLSQLAPDDEIIFGVDVSTATEWKPVFSRWRETWPGTRMKFVVQESPRQHANPKVAWLEVLAGAAEGELWLWSDADVTIPPHLLSLVRARLSVADCPAVTAAYTVHRGINAPGVLDAVYVNLEFLPGTLLLDRLGCDGFAYGALVAFRAEHFRARVNWRELGRALADDHELGRALRPVKLLPVTVSTFTQPPDWWHAWQHYYRWHKTVRWCRPGSYAALLTLLPGWGWALGLVASGGQWFFAAGLLSVGAGEVVVAIGACALVKCRLPPAAWPGLMLWPAIRALTWLTVWLPLPVRWSGHQSTWTTPRSRGAE